ncbi:MAG: 4Fe-4S binding protein [Elusimicrobiota bacterium]
MATKAMRKIVHIDEDKCDGCGQCVPSCAEGAIKIIDGKARLMADNLCDGLGACLGTCPKDAITVSERPAAAFDEKAVEEMKRKEEETSAPPPQTPCGCPGSMARTFKTNGKSEPAPAAGPGPAQSRLGHWPVQLTLLPEQGPIWDQADVVLSADCVAFALPDFHERLLSGRSLAVACPKLDDGHAYVAKLARVFEANELRSLTIARMEVPCCGGLEQIVRLAMEEAGKKVPLTVVIVGVQGNILSINGVPTAG